MPTLTDILLDPVSLAIFALYGALMLWEALFPARRLPHVPHWRLRGLAAFAGYFLLASYLPLLWTGPLAAWQLFDLRWLGDGWGAAAGLLVYEAGVYAWHRSMHRSTLLWRGFHQMHHSAERLDTYGAFWFSPLDAAGWTLLSSVCLTLVVGITAQAATTVLLATTFLSVFQHANVRTPRWLGYLVQRPESHSHHHARGVHAGNYADLPLLDLIFRTWRNPANFAPASGFYDGASSRVLDMLRFRDVSELPRAASKPASPRLAARVVR